MRGARCSNPQLPQLIHEPIQLLFHQYSWLIHHHIAIVLLGLTLVYIRCTSQGDCRYECPVIVANTSTYETIGAPEVLGTTLM